MKKFVRNLRALRKGETGATAVEYGLLVAVIALVMVGGAALFGTSLLNSFTDSACVVDAAAEGCAVTP